MREAPLTKLFCHRRFPTSCNSIRLLFEWLCTGVILLKLNASTEPQRIVHRQAEPFGAVEGVADLQPLGLGELFHNCRRVVEVAVGAVDYNGVHAGSLYSAELGVVVMQLQWNNCEWFDGVGSFAVDPPFID